jgi:hypothetical protein
MAQDAFLELLEQANEIVTQRYPAARFYEASRQVELMGSPWRFVFDEPASKPSATVIIWRLEQDFGEPEYIDRIFVGDRVIDLPISLGLDEAYALCQAYGCWSERPSWATLRFALDPATTEPKYIITMSAEGRRCFVGVRTRKVQCEEIPPG